MRGTSVIALRVLVVVATVVSCTGVLPTQLACDETTLCPTGYCCGSSGFCAPDGDPICLAPTDAGLPDAGVEPPDAGLVDAGVDAGEDAGPSTDAGTDAGPAPMDAGSGADAGADAGSDAGSDAGPGTDAGSGADGGADAGVDGGPGASDGGSDAGAAVVAPSDLTYSTNPAVYTRGQAIPDDAPSSQGGAVALYEISAALPQGLTFDPATGVVSGTPTSVVPTTSYVVTASNSGGSTQVTLTITVNDMPPSDLTYSTNPAIFTRGQPITNDSPSNSGGTVTLWAISPALPEGLSMDSMTGVVSGTPEVPAPETGYTVTATNSGGSAQVTLTITVNDVAPSGLTYATNPAVYTKGVAIPDNTPSNGGGAIVSYGVSPALPAGLSLSTTTGIISGTPTVLSAQTVYVVTGTNSGGSVQAELAITVNDKPPSGLHYATNPAVFTRNQTIAEDVPSTTGGGAVVSWAISPALPAGLSFSTATGIVSGTPTVLSSATGYTVTATNTGGSAQVTLTLTVNDEAPTGLSYATNPAVFTKGMTITSDDPSTSGGGAVVSWAISPALPSGLSFDTGTGIVSGTPTVVSAATAYLVTATNTGGSAQVTLTITVNDVAPSGLTYATNPALFKEGQAITNDVPSTTGGGQVISFAITPTLPAGLSFNATTGVVSGTPTALSPATPYTVTAMNTGGSAQVTLTITVASPPGVPTGVTATAGVGQATVNWTAPANNDSAIASYTVTVVQTGATFTTSGTTATVTGLTPGSAYTFTVTATNAVGSSAASSPSNSVTILSASPSMTTSTLTASPSSLAANGVAATTLTATIKDSAGDPLSGLTVTFSASGTGNSLTPVSAVTNTSGVATALMTSTVVQSETVYATVGTVSISTTVTFTTAVAPPVRCCHYMAYDVGNAVTVLFGGQENGTDLNDTWTWSGSGWNEPTVASGPSARDYHAMAYDSVNKVTTLFGGQDPSVLSDTWEWNGTTWTELYPSNSPSARNGHKMAYDSGNAVSLLFGGHGNGTATGGYLNDLWAWSGTAWTEFSPATVPSPRSDHAIVYDSQRAVTVLFGGFGQSGYLNDTWEWNGTNWTELFPTTSPTARSVHAMAFDAARGVTVLFGGSDNNPENDTWEWNGTTWTEIFPTTSPPARYEHAMAYDSGRQVTVLFGGYGTGGDLNDTWEWNGTTWTQRQ